ncbi:MAG: hypothetical protein AAF253_01015 [Pseudomonadota bacterium]
MKAFTSEDLAVIDRLWRNLPDGHVWTGWAAASETPEEIWIIRTRAHWRRFPLRKHSRGFALYDEHGQIVEVGNSLPSLLARVEALPGLAALADPEGAASAQDPPA